MFAVGDAVVTDVKDGIPENDPTSDKKAVPIDLSTVAGNYIILRLRPHVYAFYAHLKPGSIRVHTGQQVTAGQTIALLGNSGQADAPHLHFHLMDQTRHFGPKVFRMFFGVISWKEPYPKSSCSSAADGTPRPRANA